MHTSPAQKCFASHITIRPIVPHNHPRNYVCILMTIRYPVEPAVPGTGFHTAVRAPPPGDDNGQTDSFLRRQ